jgi:predicted RNA binding protein with dsRBD fold (UPF0201 family)
MRQKPVMPAVRRMIKEGMWNSERVMLDTDTEGAIQHTAMVNGRSKAPLSGHGVTIRLRDVAQKKQTAHTLNC